MPEINPATVNIAQLQEFMQSNDASFQEIAENEVKLYENQSGALTDNNAKTFNPEQQEISKSLLFHALENQYGIETALSVFTALEGDLFDSSKDLTDGLVTQANDIGKMEAPKLQEKAEQTLQRLAGLEEENQHLFDLKMDSQLQSILLDTLTSDSQKINKIDSLLFQRAIQENNAIHENDVGLDQAALIVRQATTKALSEWGLQPDRIEANGDCFYATVAKQTGHDKNDIRQGLETYLADNWDTLKEDENFKTAMTFANGDMDDLKEELGAGLIGRSVLDRNDGDSTNGFGRKDHMPGLARYLHAQNINKKILVFSGEAINANDKTVKPYVFDPQGGQPQTLEKRPNNFDPNDYIIFVHDGKNHWDAAVPKQ